MVTEAKAPDRLDSDPFLGSGLIPRMLVKMSQGSSYGYQAWTVSPVGPSREVQEEVPSSCVTTHEPQFLWA